MTKQDFENLHKDVREIRDLLIRNDEKLIGIDRQLKEGTNKFEDHERRIRTIESFKVQAAAYATVASSVMAVLISVLIRIIFK